MFSFEMTANVDQFEILPREQQAKKVFPVQLASFRTLFSSVDHCWENLARLLNSERVNR